MRKMLVPLLVLVLISSTVLAANIDSGLESNQTGNADIEGQDTGNQIQTSEEITAQIQQKKQVMAQNTEQLREMIQNRQQEMSQETQGLEEQVQATHQNQNKVRLAVHALLAMENLTGGIGEEVSQIAREFNNSVQTTIKAEEKIQTRDWFTKLFVGGDEEAADGIEQEVSKNQQKIQELKQLKEQCDCDEEVKAIMQEQIQNMEQEQNRIKKLAQEEKRNKGLFGWLWK